VKLKTLFSILNFYFFKFSKYLIINIFQTSVTLSYLKVCVEMFKSFRKLLNVFLRY